MARVKITEYNAKKSLLPNYQGLEGSASTTAEQITQVFGNTNLVVKLDQGIKKRGKLGLVKINVTSSEIPGIIKEWSKKGWTNFLIEPVIEHSSESEHYLALERIREGWAISYSKKGGIDVESSWDSVTRTVLRFEGLTLKDEPNSAEIFQGREGQTLKDYVSSLIPTLDRFHISFLEMNPILVRNGNIIPLDMACEVDSSASPIPAIPEKNLSASERDVALLDASTPASLKFKLLNPDGSIWVLLSGGGASLVLADEVADLGMGDQLANYGEYSGAPTDDDVYAYVKIILTQLLSAKSNKHRAIIIAGGVANFTDVVKTFRGIIRALDEKKLELKRANVKVFVRRGGPNEERGLAMMKSFLEKSGLLGSIHGHDVPLTQVANEARDYLIHDLSPRTVLKRNSRLQVEKGSSADERTVLIGTKKV